MNPKESGTTKMRVGKVMSSEVICATPDMTMRLAADLMRQHDIGALPVIEHDKIVGIVTDRDIVLRFVARKASLDEQVVGDVMSTDPISCYEDQSISQAAIAMGDAQVRRLLVLDRSEKLVGVLSIGDIAENFSEHLAGEALGEITETR